MKTKLLKLQQWAEKHNISGLETDNINELFQLKSLTLEYKKGEYLSTEYIPVEIKYLQNLDTLSIHLDDLKELPNEIGKLKKLTALTISSASIYKLPTEIYNLTILQKLTIDRCHNLITLPISEKTLSSLKELSLNYLDDIVNLECFINQCPYLEILKLQHIQIEKLPKSIYELKVLKVLILPSTKTVSLSPQIANLINLEFLECRINEISEEICQLPKLRFFNYGKGELEYISPSICNIISLGYININGKDHFETVDTLYNLELLKQGFQILDSYDEYIQEANFMKVITHQYKRESSITYIPNSDFFKLIKDENDCIKRILNITLDDNHTFELTEEEIEFKLYLQNKL